LALSFNNRKRADYSELSLEYLANTSLISTNSS